MKKNEKFKLEALFEQTFLYIPSVSLAIPNVKSNFLLERQIKEQSCGLHNIICCFLGNTVARNVKESYIATRFMNLLHYLTRVNQRGLSICYSKQTA